MDRNTEIARWIDVWPHELSDSPQARAKICQRLKTAYYNERERGRSHAASHNPDRQDALLALWRAEQAAIKTLDAKAA